MTMEKRARRIGTVEGFIDLAGTHGHGKRQKTAGQPLCQTHHIRNDSGMFASEHAAGSAEPSEYLVGDKQNFVGCAQLTKSAEAFNGIRNHSAGALDQWLHNHRRDLVVLFPKQSSESLYTVNAQNRQSQTLECSGDW